MDDARSARFKGFALALVIGTIVGALVARNRVLRSASAR